MTRLQAEKYLLNIGKNKMQTMDNIQITEAGNKTPASVKGLGVHTDSIRFPKTIFG